ncbi:MAG: hypothetical protein BWZ02_01926 [Lentisphaerae bacterium ADurb.BinA184]|nr:MAG: hypothetical protein BWZ02_01926 [Lentisphaerae bacterium ADurb.BinA184]
MPPPEAGKSLERLPEGRLRVARLARRPGPRRPQAGLIRRPHPAARLAPLFQEPLHHQAVQPVSLEIRPQVGEFRRGGGRFSGPQRTGLDQQPVQQVRTLGQAALRPLPVPGGQHGEELEPGRERPVQAEQGRVLPDLPGVGRPGVTVERQPVRVEVVALRSPQPLFLRRPAAFDDVRPLRRPDVESRARWAPDRLAGLVAAGDDEIVGSDGSVPAVLPLGKHAGSAQDDGVEQQTVAVNPAVHVLPANGRPRLAEIEGVGEDIADRLGHGWPHVAASACGLAEPAGTECRPGSPGSHATSSFIRCRARARPGPPAVFRIREGPLSALPEGRPPRRPGTSAAGRVFGYDLADTEVRPPSPLTRPVVRPAGGTASARSAPGSARGCDTSMDGRDHSRSLRIVPAHGAQADRSPCQRRNSSSMTSS